MSLDKAEQLKSDLAALTDAQAGIVTHAQAAGAGRTESWIEHRLRSERWRRVHHGIYATFTGPLPREAELWAALLWAGKGAMLSHETALEVAELIDKPSAEIHLTVPSARRPAQGKPMPGVVIHRSDQVSPLVLAPPGLPRTSVEDTVLDLAAAAAAFDDAYSWASLAFTRGQVPVDTLRQALDRRSRFPRRLLFTEVLDDAAAGVNSRLESRYARAVGRAHGLPAPVRHAQQAADGKTYRTDNWYEPYGICVELCGITYPGDGRAGRGQRRQDAGNADPAAADTRTFSFDFVSVTEEACRSAALVAAALRRRGWQGEPRSCRQPDCVAGQPG
jgi:hypothetical protein